MTTQRERLNALRDEMADDVRRQEREQGRQWQREAFQGAVAGRARVASPIAGPGGPSVPAVTIQRGGPAGEIIHLSGTSVPLASGGADLVNDTIVDRYGFSATVVGAEWVYPRTATYKHDLEFEWDSFQGGGRVELLVNGNVVYTNRDDGGGAGQGFQMYPTPIRATKGDVGKIRITQSSGSPQDGSWNLYVSVQEPIVQKVRGERIDLQHTPLDVTWDGANFWYTERDTNAIRKVDLGGNVLATISVSGWTAGFPYGVGWDGTHLWVGSSSGGGVTELRKIATDGTIITTYTTSAIDGEMRGLTYGDGHVWIVGGVNAKVFKIDPATGSSVASFAFPNATGGGEPFTDSNAAAWQSSGRLWLGQANPTDTVYRVNESGTVAETHDVSVDATLLYGATVSDGKLWIADHGTDQLVQLEVNI